MIKKILHSLATCSSIIVLSAIATNVHAIEQNNKNKLPSIGTSAFTTLSIDKERLIGNAMMQQLRASQPVIHDPVLDEYINELGNSLVKNAQDVHYGFEFFLINRKDINAFAFFGGHVGIHAGLITDADTESELASVLAHEISHVTQRHLARRLDAQARNQPLTMAGLMSGVLLSLINPTVGFAALSTSMAASQQAGLNYTRGNEQEADRVGIALLARSGFDPQGAPDFFDKLANKYRYASKPPAMLLTHPLPDSRISDARNRAQQFPAHKKSPNLAFLLAKARLKARYQGNAKDNILRFKADIKTSQGVVKTANLYGLALSYFEDKQYQAAQDILLALQHKDSKNLFYLDVLTDIYIALKQYKQGLSLLAKMNHLMPNNQVVALNYANLLQEAKHYQQAELILQDFLLIQPEHFLANDLLTTVYQKQDKKALMHASKAEVLRLLGAYPRAIDELQTAINFTVEKPLLRKRFKARILQLKSEESKLKRL